MDYSIRPALQCGLIDDVYVNSEDLGYLELGKALGAKVYQRPAELATDTAPMKPVLEDFTHSLTSQRCSCDAVVVLYPVYPFRTEAELTRMINAFWDAGGERPMIGLKPVKTHPYLCYTQEADGSIHPVVQFDLNKYYRRQLYPDCFEITYYACIIPTGALKSLNAQLQNDCTLGYRVDPRRALDIDSPEDFALAERIISESSREKS